MRIAVFPLLALVVLAAPAGALAAAERGSPVEEAVRGLGRTPVYVAPDAGGYLTAPQAAGLRRVIEARDVGPVYVAVFAPGAAGAAGGDTAELVRDVATGLRRPGTYVIVTGRRLHAGSTVLPGGLAGELADAAVAAWGRQGLGAVLTDFVRRLGVARAGVASAGSRDDDGGIGLAPPLMAAGILVLSAALLRRRRIRRRVEARRVAQRAGRDQARTSRVSGGDD